LSATHFYNAIVKCKEITLINLDKNIITQRLTDLIQDKCVENRKFLVRNKIPEDKKNIAILRGVYTKKADLDRQRKKN